jgi:hypothetical protein
MRVAHQWRGAAAVAVLAYGIPVGTQAETVALTPSILARVGAVSERYQSYNIEMVEVTGGRFWRPYGAGGGENSDNPAGASADRYQYRPPIDLTNVRLKKLAAALGPAFVRVSGTWANTTYFAAADERLSAPPTGFSGILTRARWQGVVAVAEKVGGLIVTSFAIGAGTRDRQGVWTTDQAGRLLDYTRSIGGHIAAAEFMNEPSLAASGGAPAGYDAAGFGRDFKVFHALARQAAPDMLILGPGSVGETTGRWGIPAGSPGVLATADLLAAMRPAAVDAFSYHHYGAASQRCVAIDAQAAQRAALSEDWLRRTDETLAFYRQLRDRFAPGKPLWVTETAEAACGGNPWARGFLDSFRYLDQLGRLARQDVQVVMHNTLAASDYGLLDETTFAPRPNYWSALLWRRLMGATVLDAGVPIREGAHIYAHCLRGVSGGVALLAINNSRTQATSLALPVAADRYTLTAEPLDSTRVALNGRELTEERVGDGFDLPAIRIPAGPIELVPASITFLAIPIADNANCR